MLRTLLEKPESCQSPLVGCVTLSVEHEATFDPMHCCPSNELSLCGKSSEYSTQFCSIKCCRLLNIIYQGGRVTNSAGQWVSWIEMAAEDVTGETARLRKPRHLSSAMQRSPQSKCVPFPGPAARNITDGVASLPIGNGSESHGYEGEAQQDVLLHLTLATLKNASISFARNGVPLLTSNSFILAVSMYPAPFSSSARNA